MKPLAYDKLKTPFVKFFDERTNDIARVWRDYLDDISQRANVFPWINIDFTDSELSDIETRPHSDLQLIGEADETSADITKDKHVSNNQLKVVYDDIDALEAKFTVTSEVATFTAGDTMIVMVDATAGAVIVNLPTTASGITAKARYVIKKVDSSANFVTITPNGAETIDGELTMIISTQYDSISIAPYSTEWSIL